MVVKSVRIGLAMGMIAVGLAGCAHPPTPQVPAGTKFATGFDSSPAPAAIPVEAGAVTRSVMLKTLGISRIPNGESIGGAGLGANCTLAARNSFANPNKPEEPTVFWRRPFFQLFKAANYTVMNDPNNMFEDKTQLHPDYLVGASVISYKKNDCFKGNVVNIQAARSSEVDVAVEWQFYDSASNTVVLTVDTHGYYKGDVDEDPIQTKTYERALENNVRMLLANQQVHDLLIPPAGPAQAAAGGGSAHLLTIKEGGQLRGPITGNMTQVQNSVVTITFSTGHGSGVIISKDGYVLTAKHVVGNAKKAIVKTSDGKDLSATVVAIDQRFDAALLKTNEPIPGFLPVAEAPIAVGAEVYAVGTPLSKDLAASVTKGVVSGYRTVDGVSQIQSDVSIMPGNSGGPLLDGSGNIVGLSRSMVGLGGLPIKTGISFFTPIDQVLQSVNIALQR